MVPRFTLTSLIWSPHHYGHTWSVPNWFFIGKMMGCYRLKTYKHHSLFSVTDTLFLLKKSIFALAIQAWRALSQALSYNLDTAKWVASYEKWCHMVDTETFNCRILYQVSLPSVSNNGSGSGVRVRYLLKNLFYAHVCDTSYAYMVYSNAEHFGWLTTAVGIMDMTGYRPPCMPEAPRVPYYRPPVAQSEPPWPPRFSAPPPSGAVPQYGRPDGQPPQYKGVRNSTTSNNAWPPAPETGMMKYGEPVGVTGVKPGWHDSIGHGYSNANDRARLHCAKVNSVADRKSSHTMEVDNGNTWSHQDNYLTNNSSAVTFPTGMHSMPPPSHNAPAGMHSMPPPSHNSAVAPPPPLPSRGYMSSAELLQPPPATPVYLQRPPLIQYSIPPPDRHPSQPPVTQYSVRLKETAPPSSAVRPPPAVTRPYTESRSSGSFATPTLQAPDKVVVKESEDQVWVNRWLERHGTFRRRKTKPKKQISVRIFCSFFNLLN